ncbi:MAG: OmpA family protein [Gammaproteobacteria bacterium]
MGRIVIWIVGLALLSVVYAAAIHFQVGKIESDLEGRSNFALQNISWANVVIDGRDVLIEGIPPNIESIAIAKKAVSSVWGVRKIECQCMVNPRTATETERPSIDTPSPTTKENALAINTSQPLLPSENPDLAHEIQGQEKNTKQQCQSNIGKLLKENSVEFPTGSSRISPESFTLLNDLVTTILECSETRVKVSGHTDNIGEAEKNSALSLDRAEAVKLFFQKAGIPQHRLRAVGYGDSSPIDDNNTEEGRRRNRRIEIDLTTP